MIRVNCIIHLLSFSTFLFCASTHAREYVTKHLLSTGAFRSQVASGDFDNDGRLDGAVSLLDAEQVKVFFADESVWNIDTPGFQPCGISTGFINDDAHLDIVVCDRLSGIILAFFGTGAQNFTGPHYLFQSEKNGGCHQTVVIDVDGDGRNDIISSTQRRGDIFFIRNNGLLSNWQKEHFEAMGEEKGTHHIAPSRAPDGLLDLVVCSDEGPARWYRYNQTSKSMLYTKPLMRRQVAARIARWVDLNQNGLLDLVVCWKWKPTDSCRVYRRKSNTRLKKVFKMRVNSSLLTNYLNSPMGLFSRRRDGGSVEIVVCYLSQEAIISWSSKPGKSYSYYGGEVLATGLKRVWTIAPGSGSQIFATSRNGNGEVWLLQEENV